MWFTAAFGLLKSLNIKRWIGFLASRWKEVLVILVVSLLLYQMFSPRQFLFGLDTIPSLNRRVTRLETDLKISEANFKVCQEGNLKLSQAIDTQNESIRNWGNVADKIDESTAILQQEIDESRIESKRDVENILRDATPQTCKEAIDYLREGLDELKWQER